MFEYNLIFSYAPKPEITEVNKLAVDGWELMQMAQSAYPASKIRWAYIMRREIIVVAPVPVSTDDFERADGALGPNWAVPTASESPVIISSGAAKASVPGAICMAYWSATSFGNDQYSEVELGEVTDNSGVTVRVDAQSDHFFMGVAANGATSRLYQYAAGTWNLLNDAITTWVAGDRMRLGIRGSVHPFHLNLYRNDELVCSWTSTSAEQVKTGGSPGISFSGQAASIVSWSGGDIEGSNDVLVGTFTVSLADDRILIPSHGLADGDQVLFVLDDPATCALPTPLVENAYYFVMGARGNDFQVTTHVGGTRLIIEDRGTGSNEVWKKT